MTEDEWAVPKSLLPKSNNRCGRWRDHRQVINGIIHRLSTGCQWCKLPESFGPWQTVHEGHQPWPADGTWERLLQHVQAEADAAGDVDWDVNIDSTSVRAHQHTAGAPKKAPPAASKGAAERSVHVRAQGVTCWADAVRRAKDSAAPAEG
ncbi:IS5 family transposase [Streptomyces sp. GS7]|uniref:IS5 family transposase n=1 Tax=Streptomyces sp. GS7 TaxID=2692234 RepID=UPI0022A8977C|nr:IS5 family transposase [Streptomyces sp. GS7]